MGPPSPFILLLARSVTDMVDSDTDDFLSDSTNCDEINVSCI